MRWWGENKRNVVVMVEGKQQKCGGGGGGGKIIQMADMGPSLLPNSFISISIIVSCCFIFNCNCVGLM